MLKAESYQMNMIKSGLNWARTQLKTNVASKIRITRSGIASSVLTAIKAGPEADQYDDAGAFISRVRQIDWLIDPADYVVGGSAVEPTDDDVIEEVTVDGSGNVTAVLATYAVSSPSQGENPWRYTDPERTMFRVHVAEQ